MRCFFAPLLLHVICAELGYDTIKESLNWRAADGAGVRHSGPLNPLQGFLLSGIGAVHNKRFFSPENIPVYEINLASGEEETRYRRYYNRDTALDNDQFHKTLLDLFPSSSGRVSIAMTRSGSFYYELSKRGRPAAVRLLAALAAMTLGTDIKWTPKTTGKRHSVTIHVSPPVEMQGPGLDEVADVVAFFAGKEGGAEYLRSKTFLLQGFLHHFLDTRAELETFFGHVYELAGRRSGAFTEPGETDTVGYTLLETAIQMNRAFPFSPVNQLPTNITVPFYSRQEGIIDSKHFSDCGEAALLGLVCCLLYDSKIMEYTKDHLRKGELKKFFTRHRKIFPITMETRTEWLRVVEDLPEQDIVYVKTHRDRENNRIRNEIKSGHINMLAVLRTIARPKPSFELALLLETKEKPFSYSEIQNEFEKAFMAVISQVGGREIPCDFGHLRVENIPKTGTWDVFGSVKITIPAGMYGDAVLELVHSLGHAEVRVLQYPFAHGEDEADSVLESANALIGPEVDIRTLIGRYVRYSVLKDPAGDMLYSDMVRTLEKGLLHNIFVSGTFDTDRTKGRLLDALFPYTMKKEMHAVQIARNLVSSAALDDKATSFKYAPFVLLDGSLRDFEGALDVWWRQAPRHRVPEWAVRERYVNVACYCIHIDRDVQKMPNTYDLVHLLVQHGRVDCIRELVGLYGRSMDMLVKILEIGVRHSFKGFTDDFFNEIRKEDLEKCKHSVEGVEQYLEERALRRETSPEDLQKIYYWFFCANNLGPREQRTLFHIVSETYTRVGTDFLYDCIVRRCPSFHEILFFYKSFLELAIKKQVKVRNDVLVLLKQLAHTHLDKARGLKQEIAALMDSVGKAGLVDNKINFSRAKYEKFIEEYARDGADTNLEHYIRGVNSIFGGKEALTPSFTYTV